MSQIQSRVNTRSEEFLANAARMEELVGDLRDRLEEIKRVVERNTRIGISHAASCLYVIVSMP